MKSLWRHDEAADFVARYADVCSEAVALRVYTSRLIGRDAGLVLHGGGNTSVKASFRTILGDEVPALYVKGSGSSLDRLEPRDLPALDLAYLLRLRGLPTLSDEEMVNQLRTHLFDASAPNPSVETLLHAFLPHRFVDHSHADAVLVLTNQPEGDRHVREALGDEVLVLPFVMPGFPLALAVADAVEKAPHARAVVLSRHGLFTFGDSARESYERHVEAVAACEAYLERKAAGRVLLTPRPGCAAATREVAEARVAQAAPILRGLLANHPAGEEGPVERFVLEWRGDEAVQAFCASEEAHGLAETAPLTPDHVIRTKAQPLFVADPAWGDEERLRGQLAASVAAFRGRYSSYFEAQCRARNVAPTRLDSSPRVVLLPGAGALCFGRTKQDAVIAADIAEHTLAAKGASLALGAYQGLSDSDLFDMEYWSLEQAKLGRARPRALEGRVVLVTGGAGAIGVGVGEACAAAGAHVVLADLDLERAQAAAASIAKRHGDGAARGLAMDVCDEASVRRGFDAACRSYGGVDVVVPNAGVAHVAPIEQLDAATVRRVADVNYLGVLLAIREAARLFRAQGTGGHVIVNASKNVFAPGREFGAYSASKAAAHQIGKIAALELAPLGVRVNLINADAVFGDEATPSGLWQEVGPARAASRGISESELPEFYRGRNLLKARVTARHVGNAVVFFASDQTPTTGATLPVDGGIPEAFPR
jgi:rhamnulose-1-phosphate aldolase/alcohol dehydrogenase